MKNDWSIQIASQCILNTLTELKITHLITFDDYGVSGHPNHISTFRATKEVLKSLNYNNKTNIVAYQLESVNIFRKFSFFIDIGVSKLLNNNAFINFDIFTIFKAMLSHKSQFIWYRKLFVVFSRYSYVNTFQPIKL